MKSNVSSRRVVRRPKPCRPRLELLEERLALATHIWTGALSNLWSNGGNWTGGSPAGDTQAVLSFPAAVNLTNINDLTGLKVAAIDFAAGNYALSGNAITLVQGPSGAPRIHMDAAAKTNTIAIDLGRVATNLGITVDVASGSTLTVAGVISGGAATTTVVKDGPGKLVLSGANTFADSVLINAGALTIRDGTALGTTSTGETNRTTVSGGTLELEGSLFVTESLFQGVAGGIVRNVSGNSTWAGEMFLASTDLTAQVENGGSLTISGKIFDNTAGPILGVNKTGPGKLALTATNTYRGATTVNAGILNINNAAAFGTADGGTTVKTGATFELQGFVTVAAEPLTIQGGDDFSQGIRSISGNNEWRGPITLVNSPAVMVVSGTLTLSGVIGGSTGLLVVGAGATGKLILTSANTYTGATTVGSGTLLIIQNPLALGQAFGPSVVVFEGGTLELELQGTNSINEGLSLGGTGAGGNGALRNVSGINTWTGGVLLDFASATIGVSGGQLTISGEITQPGVTEQFGITKVGDGALFLSGTSTIYRGATNVNAGSLFVNGDLSNSKVFVNAGRLGGTGVVFGIVANAGVVNPGVGVGRLTVSNGTGSTASFSPGSIFEVDLNGTGAGTGYDQLSTFFQPRLGSSTLKLHVNFFLPQFASFKIIDTTGSSNLVGGTFAGLPEGAIISTLFGSLRISYKGGDGNDVVLTTVNTSSRFPDRSVTPVIDEGGVATLTGTISDPDLHDVFFLDVNWGDGTPTEKHVFPPGSDGKQVQLTHRYRDDNPTDTLQDAYNIQLAWHDKAGEGNSATLTTTVRNVAPVLDAINAVQLPPSGVLRQFVTFTDPGRDTWTATVDYGDGSEPQLIDVHGGQKFMLNHRYSQSGTYTVKVTVTDDDGGEDTTSFEVQRVDRSQASLVDAFFALLDDPKNKSRRHGDLFYP